MRRSLLLATVVALSALAGCSSSPTAPASTLRAPAAAKDGVPTDTTGRGYTVPNG